MPESAKPLVSALVVSRNAKEELLQCLKGFGLSASRGGVLHDLGQGAVEVGNQDYFAWLYTS